ncbi:MAG: response regulator transcription factor [Geobacteraceae bacterium]
MSTRVLLVDNHNLMREGLKALLGRTADIEVVAEATTGKEALQQAAQFCPDVIVMDLKMPEMNGIETTQGILAGNPDIKVLALSMVMDRVNIIETLKAGAKGYLSKDCVFEELVDAIHALAEGKSYLGAEVTELVIKDFTENMAEDSSVKSNKLSKRELEVLQHIADGRNTKNIAFTLGVCVKTVEIHRMNIMKRLSLYSIAELTKYAVREGLTTII